MLALARESRLRLELGVFGRVMLCHLHVVACGMELELLDWLLEGDGT